MSHVNRSHREIPAGLQRQLAEARKDIKEAKHALQQATAEVLKPGGDLLVELLEAITAGVDLHDAQQGLKQLQAKYADLDGPEPSAPSAQRASAAQHAQTAGRRQGDHAQAQQGQVHGKTEVNVASFNVLGSSHTRKGGNKPGYRSGPERMKDAVKALKRHKVDVVGFQEFEKDQLHKFTQLTDGKFGVFPGNKPGLKSSNSIAWNKEEWKLVKADTVKIPYFEGHIQKMPVVLLQNRETGQKAYFTNFHNPASTRFHPNNEKWRDKATRIEIDLVNRLKKKTGLPVFLTGDMNEKQEFRDKFQRGTGFANSQRQADTRAERRVGIDWIFGGNGVKFTDYDRDTGVQRRRVSDHPLVVAHAVIRG